MTQQIQITFYKSALCPRCKIAGKYLEELQHEFAGLIIDTIDVGSHPVMAFRAGITMIPAIVAGEKKLSMLLPKKERIRKFINEEVVSQ